MFRRRLKSLGVEEVLIALTTYLGWTLLKVDPTLVAGGAFFIIGFDTRTTWVIVSRE